jgi:hypothetical protein
MILVVENEYPLQGVVEETRTGGGLPPTFRLPAKRHYLVRGAGFECSLPMSV